MSADLCERLAARRSEIEGAVLTRVCAVEDPTEVGDAEYAGGLREAVSVGVSFALSALSECEHERDPVPIELLAQARRAARSRVGLDTVLRRYVAGHALLDDFIVQEAGAPGRRQRSHAQRALRTQALLLDRVVDVIAAEYRSEVEARLQWHPRSQARCVEKLLAGEPVDVAALDYDLSGWHIGAVAMGSSARATLSKIAKDLGFRLLCVPRTEGVLWAWLGGARRHGVEELESPPDSPDPQACIVTGEPAQGLSGWRFSHRQALAALPVGLRVRHSHVRYSDVALLASMLQDEVLLRSLTELYLAPLAAERDGGEVSRETLRAYFSAQRNVSSTASLLEVSRKTVTARLRRVEQRLGRPLHECVAELEAVLNLQAMGDLTAAPKLPQSLIASNHSGTM